MALFDVQNDQLKTLREQLKTIAAVDPFEPVSTILMRFKQGENLASPDDMVALNNIERTWKDGTNFFTDANIAQEYVAHYKRIFSPLLQCPLDNPLLDQLGHVAADANAALDNLQNLHRVISDIRAGRAGKTEFSGALGQIRTHLTEGHTRDYINRAICEELHGISAEWNQDRMKGILDEATQSQASIRQIQDDADKWLDQTKAISKDMLAKLEEKHSEVSSVLEKIGTRESSARFKGEADKQSKHATYWACGAIAMVVLLLVYAFFGLDEKIDNDHLGVVIPKVAARLGIIALGSVALAFCIRNYGACQHNCTVNRHREHALNTFDYFVNAGSDDATKNTILIETAKVIFTPANSGYLKAASEPGSSTGLLEVVRHIATKDPHS